jgi:hypothetical protein
MLDEILVDPSILRLLWSIVSNLRYQSILDLSDRELCDAIVRDIRSRVCLDSLQQGYLNDYLNTRTILIRDSIASAGIESIESFALG